MIVREGESCSLSKSFMSTSVMISRSSAVKILCLSWHTSKFIHLLSIIYNCWWWEEHFFFLFSKIRYNKLLCYSFGHVHLFLARSRLYTPLLVMHS